MLAQLVALGDGSSILLDKPVLLLGRHPECDIQIDSRKISRRHCCIAMVADYLVVRDLGSTNGIRVNGVRVIEGRLRTGDQLTIGSHQYQVRLAVPQQPANGPAAIKAAPPLQPARPAFPGLRPVAVNDEMLEACEEPVPLAEPVAPPVRPIRTPLAIAEDSSDEIVPVLPVPPPPAPSAIIPDQLELVPPSEAAPPLAPAPDAPSPPPSPGEIPNNQ